jgi:GNAT superfamily N-acetyltransferase
MKIRLASKFDLPDVIRMLKNYRDCCPLEELKLADNEEYINTVFTTIIYGGGVCLIAEDCDQVVGMLMAVRAPSIWDPKIYIMKEMCYWVDLEHRLTSAGYRLLKEYKEYCDKEKDAKHINLYTVSKMISSPDLKYDRFGFELLEETWRQ